MQIPSLNINVFHDIQEECNLWRKGNRRLSTSTLILTGTYFMVKVIDIIFDRGD